MWVALDILFSALFYGYLVEPNLLGILPWMDTIRYISQEIRVEPSLNKEYLTWKIKTIHKELETYSIQCLGHSV